MAEYVGQTAPKTMAVIQKALGGVLFVDEAYSLASNKGQGSSYNEEAIATLIQAMENYRDRLHKRNARLLRYELGYCF